MHWLDFLFPPRVDEIAVRDISNDDFLALVNPQLVPYTRPSTVILLPFSDARVRTAIHEAKYRGNKRAFELLALALVEYLRDADDVERPRRSFIVPVPLGKARMKERGYNQAEEIAKFVAKELGIEIKTDLLIRTRETKSQVSLQREEREKNMCGAFKTTQSANPAHTYIVIDDVITTGATLQAAVDVLKEVGAEHIIPLALAH